MSTCSRAVPEGSSCSSCFQVFHIRWFFTWYTSALSTTRVLYVSFSASAANALLFFSRLCKLYTKLRCDDRPLLEHAEQLLGELGGEMDANEGNPEADEEFEPRSDEEEESESAMEH